MAVSIKLGVLVVGAVTARALSFGVCIVALILGNSLVASCFKALCEEMIGDLQK